MDIPDVAARLLEMAAERGQAVLRCDGTTPVADLRAAVRRAASARHLRVRTGMVDDVLTVVLADAALWGERVGEMRRKLVAPTEPNVVA